MMTDHQGARGRLVEQARRRWIDELIPRSRDNKLLYFKPRKTRTVELESVAV